MVCAWPEVGYKESSSVAEEQRNPQFEPHLRAVLNDLYTCESSQQIISCAPPLVPVPMHIIRQKRSTGHQSAKL